MKSSKNVLVLMADQHKVSVSGCYGHPLAQTPNIDRIAANGLRYDNAYCASPLCGPSRMAWATGCYPNKNWNVTHPNKRHRTGKVYEAPVNPDTPSLVTTLRDEGYETFGSGYHGLHASANGKVLKSEDFGFSQWADCRMSDAAQTQYSRNHIYSEMWEPNYQNVDGNLWTLDEPPFDTHVADNVCSFIESSDPSRPFFAYAGFRAPHPPWVPPPEFRALYDASDIELPDYKVEYRNKPRRVMERLHYYDCRYYPEEVVRESMACYLGFVSYMDSCVGMILKSLEAKGLMDDTIIIYTADHGELLYDNGLCEKHTFFEGAIRIPLILQTPGYIPANTNSPHPVENIDIFPTILSMNGIPVPEHCNGVDLTPTFDGQPVKDMVFSEYCHTLDPCRMVKRDQYKYVHTEDDINELYDLSHDPLEEHNLAFYPGYADLCAEFEEIVLENWDVPQVPLHATWNDLNERKQKQLLAGLDIHNFRPKPPDWVRQ